jgi:hypothetical protein
MARWVDRNALGPEGAFRLWVEDQVLGFRSLRGHSVARWVGNEMAVREVGPSGSPVFYDPTVPYLQICPLYLEFAAGGGRDIHTYQNLWPDGWGLCIDTVYGGAPAEFSEPGSSVRTRWLQELPVGLIKDVRVVQDSERDIIEVSLKVAGDYVTLWSGEVYEEADGTLRVVRPDESVLVAVARPDT